MSEILIRKLVETDLEDVVRIEKQTFTDPWTFAAFKSDIGNEMAWPLAAFCDNVLAGYSCIYIVAGELQIGNFAVADTFRGRGIAKALMNEIIKIALEKKCDAMFLEVRESNAPAQALYKSFGFKAVGRRLGYYNNPRENAILMVKEF
jgi:ribosomal-protein-alanine N-acetyltransferase